MAAGGGIVGGDGEGTYSGETSEKRDDTCAAHNSFITSL